MILLTISAAEAKVIAERMADHPELFDRLCAQLRQDEVFEGVVDAPRVVLYRDDGDGLHVAAIAYYEDKAADVAFERFGELVQKQHERLGGPLFAKAEDVA